MIKILINMVIFIISLITITKLTDTQFNIKNKKNFLLLILLIISSIITIYLSSKKNSFFLISILTNITMVSLHKILFEKYRINYKINYKNIIMYIFIGLSISFILETTLFNFRYYQSLNYKEIEIKNIIIDEKITNHGGILTVEENGLYSVEILNINEKIHNIYIDIENKTGSYIPLDINILLTDEANKEYFYTPEVTLSEKIEKSKYLKVNTSGKSEKISILANFLSSQTYSIKSISLNKKVPLQINIVRIIFFAILIIFYFLFCSKSDIYKTELLKCKNKNLSIIFLITFEIIICSIIFISNPEYLTNNYLHHTQYQELSKSFAKGKLSIDLPISEKLKELENPYDSLLREKHGLLRNKDFVWDTAFYKGKYYVYFGALPVVTSYLPYYLITGENLQNHHLVYIIGILTIISFIYLIYEIIKRWFKKTSMGTFLLVAILMINSSGLLILYKCHDLYGIPIIYSLSLVSLGLGLWISSYDSKTKTQNLIKLSIGSFCMALVAGCRPQFLIGSLLVFPIFTNYFIKEKTNQKRKLKELCALLLPYIIVAIPIMMYNYYRFGSILDFGATYNLTTNDMTRRGVIFERNFTGLYYYLLSPPYITPTFPFLNAQSIETTYLGKTIFEPIFGGFLVCNLICAVSIFVPKFKKSFPNKEIYYIALLSSISGIIVIIFDIQMAGILNRYICDFAWLLIIPTILIILSLEQKKIKKESFYKVIAILITLSIIYSISNAIFDETYALRSTAPTIYEQLKHFICFWL